MKKGAIAFLIAVFLIPLAYSVSIRGLVSRYAFSAQTQQMNVTNYADFMVDKNNNGANDTLIFELTINNTGGTFIFVLNLFDKNGILINETNKTLNTGINKLNISFGSALLSQPQFNYSIKIYNSSYNLKYRKDNILTQNYPSYEEGFRVLDIKDSMASKTLKINITINSPINGLFETALFLAYNNSIILAKDNKSIANSVQDLIFDFGSDAIKRTHYAGSFNVSSLKIGKKQIKTNFTTSFYDFRDFAAASYISGFADTGVDTDSDKKYNLLQINASMQITEADYYSIILHLHDLFGNLIEIKNITAFLNIGNNSMLLPINGSRIYDKKLNGPFVIKYAELYKNYALADKIEDAYATGNYDFNDFDNPNLPDLNVNISVSGGHHYGISNITVNFTFKNSGNRRAFSVFTDIFDNKTFSRSNKSNILNVNSQITYQVNFTNISDFEVSAIADLQGIVEELNESDNAERVVIKLNKRPNLASVNNVTANETGRIIINLSASDMNEDVLSFSINSSRFSGNFNAFEWNTTTTDSGNYTLSATASDGFLNDSAIFKVVILDAPEKDFDNDGINDSIDRLIGDENSVNASMANLKIFAGDSRNLSKMFNGSAKVKFAENNSPIAEFDFNFSLYKLNLTGLAIHRQPANSTGSLLFKGLKMHEGATKALYVDRINTSINGICVKDGEISSISEISESCGSGNEFKVECDGTLQNSYICAYNSTLNKYKVHGLRHSGIMQLAYTKPAPESSGTSTSATSGSNGGGGGGAACISDWQCSEWSMCVNGFKNRKCSDSSQCAFPANKPMESQQCLANASKTNIASAVKSAGKKSYRAENIEKSKASAEFVGITGHAVGAESLPKTGFDAVLGLFLIIAWFYLSIKSGAFLKIFK